MAKTMKKVMKKAVAGKKMVMKSKAVVSKASHSRQGFAKALVAKGKIRVGILHGKDFDPVMVGTQDRNYPEKLKVKNNKWGWGGQFHIDVNTGTNIRSLHPDVFQIDWLAGTQITPARLKKNHINLAFWHDPMVAMRDARDMKAKGPGHIKNVETCFKDPSVRMWPNYEMTNWIGYKPNYMRALEKAKIPIIPTIYCDNGFDPKEVLRKVKAKGWKDFFVKVGFAAFFGEGAINGSVKKFEENPKLLQDFAKENKMHKCFLVQPYMLKPNGEVFDEIRNFFVEGVWYSGVFTHGTDMSNAGYYQQPPGKLRDAVKALATRAYGCAKAVAMWQGKNIETLNTRIDVGIIPDKKTALGYRIFVNEVEPETATWLARYWPFDMTKVMGPACVNKIRELLKIYLAAGKKLPNEAVVRHNLELLDQRLNQ